MPGQSQSGRREPVSWPSTAPPEAGGQGPAATVVWGARLGTREKMNSQSCPRMSRQNTTDAFTSHVKLKQM